MSNGQCTHITNNATTFLEYLYNDGSLQVITGGAHKQLDSLTDDMMIKSGGINPKPLVTIVDELKTTFENKVKPLGYMDFFKQDRNLCIQFFQHIVVLAELLDHVPAQPLTQRFLDELINEEIPVLGYDFIEKLANLPI